MWSEQAWKVAISAIAIVGMIGVMIGWGQVQTSAQDQPSRPDRLLEAEEAQAAALRDIARELRNTNDRLRSIERRCR